MNGFSACRARARRLHIGRDTGTAAVDGAVPRKGRNRMRFENMCWRSSARNGAKWTAAASLALAACGAGDGARAERENAPTTSDPVLGGVGAQAVYAVTPFDGDGVWSSETSTLINSTPGSARD